MCHLRRIVLIAACGIVASCNSTDGAGNDASADGGTIALQARMLGPDLVAVGGCAEVAIELIDESENIAMLVEKVVVSLSSGPQLAFSITPDCAATSTELALTLEPGPASARVWVAGVDVGSDSVEVKSGGQLLGLLELGVVEGYDNSRWNKTALVVYNSNVPDSLELAEYYAAARGIEAERLCPVPLPPGVVASADELLGARRVIVEECICPILDPAVRPSPCTVGQAESIAAVSPISHLVLMKGIPTRLTETGWTSDDESPSLAPFLSYLLYHDEVIFGDDSKRALQPNYPTQAPMRIRPPPLSPKDHGWAAYGHLEAADNAATRALIDRTMAAEARGFTGNVLVEEDTTSVLSRFLIELTSTFSDECFSYRTHTPFVFGEDSSSWPHDRCRYGTTHSPVATQSGGIPGEVGTTVPSATNVGLFLGTDPWPNTQVGFDGFDTMLQWHEGQDDCTTLCADLATQAEVDACRVSSSDYFAEINTGCVGVAEGFLGFQIRSWPVQYMGFFPSGWGTRESGQLEKDAPKVRTGDAFTNARFADDQFVRFGQSDFEEAASSLPSVCETGDGKEVSCRERVAINMVTKVELDPPLPFLDGERVFRIRARYRNGASPPDGAIIAYGIFEEGGTDQWDTRWVIIPSANPNWTTWEFTVTARQASLNGVPSLGSVSLMFSSQPTPQPAMGYVDFDGIEIIDDATGTQLLATEIGSFSATRHLTNRAGDFAANVIDRLGGVGSWGSTSHFVTGGWAFRSADRFAGLFFSGRSLGESILSSRRPQSGLIFGDPLYRPVAIRLSGPDGANMLSIDDLAQIDDIKTLTMTAMLGTGSLDSLLWSIESCQGWDLESCEAQWQPRLRGVGAVDGAKLDWTDFKTLDTPGEQFSIRLRMWNADSEDEALSSYVRIEFQTKEAP